MEHLREFLVTGHEDLQPVRIQSLGEEGAPRQVSQCQERAGAHLLFTETSPKAAQASVLSKEALLLHLGASRISEFSQLPPLVRHSSGTAPHPSANQILAPTETLGVLARAVGEPMKSLAEECCQLGLGLCDQVDDPDLRRCT